MAVDYLTRYINNGNLKESFKISLMGAEIAGETRKATKLLNDINGLDDASIINACKLCGYDVCYRAGTAYFKNVDEINPDEKTIFNIKTMVKRGIAIVRESIENMLVIWKQLKQKKKENLKEKEKKKMETSKIKKALIEQKNMNLSGNLYHKTQIDFAYNTNHMEGSTITPDETASIYDTGTILTSSDKVIVLKDATETKNHFTLFKYMLDTIEEKLSEDMIKKFHFILKDGTLTDSENEWFNVGDYKKRKNFVGNITTTLPKDVEKDMKDLLNWYDSLTEKKIEDIIEFHVRFEQIHPFQDGNGRVGRMIMFRECLYNDIMPFFIEERNKDFYLRGIKEYQTNNEKGYLIDTCLNSQDNYEKLVNYFLEEDNN